MKKECAHLLRLFRHWKYIQKVLKSGDFAEERKRADIIRLVHSIEKGLCLENPRLGFGVEKINKLFQCCDEYMKKYGNESFCLKMVHDALEEYIEYHKSKEYNHPYFQKICEKFEAFPVSSTEEKCGGTLNIETKPTISYEDLNTFLATRHSIRDFNSAEISDDILFKAIKTAQLAPSACNRQAVRVHIMSSKKLCELYDNKMDGIGGFAENADKFILITGKISSYQCGEYNQYIVSSSILATYLMLALQSMKIGSCIVQRPLQFSKQWELMRRKCSIPEDEQLVLMMAIGEMKPECKVPVSKRFPTEEIVTLYNAEKSNV